MSIKQLREAAGISLRELSKELRRSFGRGFSPGWICLAETGKIQLRTRDEVAIKEAITRLAPAIENRRRIVATAKDLDLSPLLEDVREARFAAARA